MANANESVSPLTITDAELAEATRVVSDKLGRETRLSLYRHHGLVARGTEVLFLFFEPHLQTPNRTERYQARLNRSEGEQVWQPYSINIAGEQALDDGATLVAFTGSLSAQEVSDIAEKLDRFWQEHAKIGNITLFAVTSSSRPTLVNGERLESIPKLTHYSAHSRLDSSTVRLLRERETSRSNAIVITSSAMGNWSLRLVREASGELTISHIEKSNGDSDSELLTTLTQAIESSPAAEEERKRFDAAMTALPPDATNVAVKSTELLFEGGHEQYRASVNVVASSSRTVHATVHCHMPVDSMESPRCVYQPMMIVQRVPDQLAPIMLQVVDISEQETFELVQAIREQATQEAEAESLEPFAVLSIKSVAEGYEARVRRGTEQYTITVRDDRVGP